jgi:SAM-dependent methyltransferase
MEGGNEIKQRVRQQYSDKGAAYATSAAHARGSSLERLVELTQPEPQWQVLDVATGAGHTAHTFAPHVSHVVASDLTRGMLATAGELAKNRGLNNMSLAVADAEALPFERGAFDLVTCRIAPHHFPDIARFMAEAQRVLRPGGLLAVVDNVVPGSRLRGKKGRLQREAGRYVNAFEKLRDPSHNRCLSMVEWREAFYNAGFVLQHEESEAKELDFGEYVARMKVAPDDVVRLKAMLVQAPSEVLDFLTPVFAGDTIKFCLAEALFIGSVESGNR